MSGTLAPFNLTDLKSLAVAEAADCDFIESELQSVGFEKLTQDGCFGYVMTVGSLLLYADLEPHGKHLRNFKQVLLRVFKGEKESF